MVQRKAGMERSPPAPGSGPSGAAVRHQGCSTAAAASPSAAASLPSHEQLAATEHRGTSGSLGMLAAPNQEYKEPQAGHFTRIQVLPAFDLVEGKKVKNGHKKPRLSAFKAFL